MSIVVFKIGGDSQKLYRAFVQNRQQKGELVIIKIDAEFKSLIPPLTPDERRQLEENILADGCLDSLKTWNDTLLDGHNRYEICTAHDLPYRTEAIPLETREDAVIWICKNQTGRRNITDEQRTYLLGKQYEAQKVTAARNQYTKSAGAQSGPERTADIIAKEMGVGHNTVKRAGNYAKGLDAIGEAAPELKAEILSGRTSATKQDVRAVAKLPEPERPAAIEKIRRGEKVKLPESVGIPSDTAPVTLPDITHSIERTFREFVDVIDNMVSVNRDLIDVDPQPVIDVFDSYIEILKEMKEGLT